MITLNYVVLYTNVLYRALLCAGMCAVKWHLRPATLTSLFSPFQCEGGLVLMPRTIRPLISFSWPI